MILRQVNHFRHASFLIYRSGRLQNAMPPSACHLQVASCIAGLCADASAKASAFIGLLLKSMRLDKNGTPTASNQARSVGKMLFGMEIQ
jgi:hypothetical protein